MMLLVVLAFLLVGNISGKSVREAPNVETTGIQCDFNGQKYNEGDQLPTRHMCLDCHCTKDFVEASDKYCDVITCPATDNLDKGCQPVYNDSDCCPLDWICGNTLNLNNAVEKCECDLRYFKHYDVKGCSAVYTDGCCPARFNCSDEPKVRDRNVCTHNGITYQAGDNIESPNPCDICSCQQHYSGERAEISCIPTECPSVFRPELPEGCYEVFQSDKCCAVRTKCVTAGDENEAKTCDYGGKKYHIGQKIYPTEDPCLICICSEDWTGIHGNSCKIHDCMLERKSREIYQGCIPIYHEKTCCPIEFHCDEHDKNITSPFLNAPVAETDCVFKGQHYPLGYVLDIMHPTNCVTCTCSTPPDFTCIHKSCPGPPNDDYQNCKSTYTKGQCCSTYTCDTNAAPPVLAAPVPQCAPVKCPATCSEVTVRDSCPFCKCDDLLCSPPKCEEGCEIEKDVAHGECPKCTCHNKTPDPDKSAKLICDPVKCDPGCHEVNNPGSCPSCVCGPLCTPPKCDEGCTIQLQGECPACVCSDSTALDRVGAIHCDPIKCAPNCRTIRGESGCPICQCSPLCSPPHCDEGCHIEYNPEHGPCPGCVCDNPQTVQCSPPNCDAGCHVDFSTSPCPSCSCDQNQPRIPPKVLCSPPKCDAPCHIDYSTSPCPSCSCDQDKPRPLCSPPKCDPPCHIDYSTLPCPSCSCEDYRTKPLCSPPKCDPPCHIDYSTSPCPSCSCEQDKPRPLCSPPKCDAGCHIDYSTKPCPSCSCEPEQARIPQTVLCSPPKCDAPCHIDYSTSPCPSCSCDQTSSRPNVLCSPPKCDAPCHIDYSTSPCPSCSCDQTSSRPNVLCSPPKCDAPCHIDYSTSPCPSCSCENNQARIPQTVLCSPPKCDAPCHIDYSTSPCPSCSCEHNKAGLSTDIQCSPPKCDPGCHVDYSSSPCPSCSCDQPRSLCSPPKCDPGCQIDYTTSPCPSCSCERHARIIPTLQCSPPKCDPGCHIDYNTSPCPSCTCDDQPRIPQTIQCSPPKCDPGCHIDYSTSPCPSCSCDPTQARIPQTIQCSPPKCDPGCHIDYSTSPCPSCSCDPTQARIPQTIQCSPPKCGPGCHIDYSTSPCPSCSCDHTQARMASPHRSAAIECAPKDCGPCNEVIGADGCPACECPRHCITTRCQPGCHLEEDPSPDQCPSCVCPRKLTRNCQPMLCQLPCRTVKFSEHACPSCICHSTSCPPLNCSAGYVEKVIPPETCAQCVPEGS